MNKYDEDDEDRNWNAIMGWSPFRLGDIKDGTSLLKQLQDGPGPLSRHVASQFNADERRLLQEWDDAGSPPELLLSATVEIFNRLLQDPCPFDPQLYQHVPLREEAGILKEQNPSGHDLLRFKRIIIEDGFHGIEKTPGYEKLKKTLKKYAGILRQRYPLRGDPNGEVDMTPDDLAHYALAQAKEKNGWDPDRGNMTKYLCLLIRSKVTHDAESSENKQTLSFAVAAGKTSGGMAQADANDFDALDRKLGQHFQQDEVEKAAERARLLNLFREDLLAREVARVIIDEDLLKPGEIADRLGISREEVNNAKKRVKRTLERIYGHLFFNIRNLKDPESLALKLRNGSDSVSLYLRPQLTCMMRTLLEEWDVFSPLSDSYVKHLVDELNRLLRNRPLYERRVFAQIRLPNEAYELISDDPCGENIFHRIRLNKLLLAAAYPGELTED